MSVSRPRVVLVAVLLLTAGASPALAKGKPPPPVATIQGGSTVENYGPLVAVLTRTGNLKKPATVTVTPTVVGLAIHPASASDFNGSPVTVTFAKNAAQAVAAINLNDDTTAEEDELFQLVLSNFSAGNVGSPASATIVDDDQSGVFTLQVGDQISWNGSMTGCNSIIAQRFDTAGTSAQIGSTSDCNTSSLDGSWINDTDDPQTVQFALDDTSCHTGYRYFYDTSEPLGSSSDPGSVDHGAVWRTSTGWMVAINDAGFGCSATTTTRQPGTNQEGNVVLDITVESLD